MCMLPTLSLTPKDHEYPVNGCVPMSTQSRHSCWVKVKK